jgi:hypothetical protein
MKIAMRTCLVVFIGDENHLGSQWASNLRIKPVFTIWKSLVLMLKSKRIKNK